MIARTANGIRLAIHNTGTTIVAGLRHISLASTSLFVLAIAWLLVAGWINYVQPQQFDLKAYERYQEKLADCHELFTSEARYDCVAKAMIGQDQMNFGKALTVFLPPLILVFGYYILREIRESRREREHAALAEKRSRDQILKMRAEMRAERAAAIAAAKAMLGHEDEQHVHNPHVVLDSLRSPGNHA
jgi:hypothetical protein